MSFFFWKELEQRIGLIETQYDPWRLILSRDNNFNNNNNNRNNVDISKISRINLSVINNIGVKNDRLENFTSILNLIRKLIYYIPTRFR